MNSGSSVLGDWVRFRNGKTSPKRSHHGQSPVFGSNGVIGYSDQLNAEGESVIIGRVGSYCGSTYYSASSSWVTDNAIIAQPEEPEETRFWYYVLSSLNLNRLSHGSGQALLNQSILKNIQFEAPHQKTRLAIAATLGAIDDKIESNRRQRWLLRSLGHAKYLDSLQQRPRSVALKDLTLSIARGVAPKYADKDQAAPLVINQKCIRDGWVSLSPARRMQERSVAPAKRATAGDILVNSTGTGTLGRIARWHSGEIFVDGHVSVVRPDLAVVPPTVLAYGLLGRESDIEELATGSTGQTELSPTRLGEIIVSLPAVSAAGALELDLVKFEDRSAQLSSETLKLQALRDALLPELLSGRISVRPNGISS